MRATTSLYRGLLWGFAAIVLATISVPHIVARLRLDLSGMVTARSERCSFGRCDIILTLDRTREVILGHRESQLYDLRSLRPGQSLVKRSGELAVAIDGKRRMWPLWASLPLFASLLGSMVCVVRSAQLLRSKAATGSKHA